VDIFEAAEVGDYDAVCSLLQLKAKPEEHQNEVGFTALLAAANKGHDAIVERLLSAGVDIDYQTKTSGLPWIQHGATALMLASLQGHGKVVATLLANKAQVDLQSTNKNTSLILASIRGHTAVVELLIGASATIDMRVSLPRSATPASLSCSRAQQLSVWNLKRLRARAGRGRGQRSHESLLFWAPTHRRTAS